MKSKNIQEAEDFLKNGSTDPHTATELRSKLSGEYSWISGQLQDILARKPREWMKMRTEVDTDKQADRKWEASDDGINETGLKMQLKVCEKMMSALKTIIEVQNNERNNSNY
jgi:hypothetical protein